VASEEMKASEISIEIDLVTEEEETTIETVVDVADHLEAVIEEEEEIEKKEATEATEVTEAIEETEEEEEAAVASEEAEAEAVEEKIEEATLKADWITTGSNTIKNQETTAKLLPSLMTTGRREDKMKLPKKLKMPKLLLMVLIKKLNCNCRQ
jgi:ATPase subunit of ABC transporter with duplicated ATPase domains